MEPDSQLSAEALASRASDADRERAVDAIKAAFAEGRLNQEEHSQRVSMALRSGTYSDLARLTSDLPAGRLGVLTSSAVPTISRVVSPFDWRAALMSVSSIALAAFFFNYPVAPLTLLLALILTVAASVRSRRFGPRWERLAIWGVSGVMGVALIGFILTIFL